MLLPHSPLTLPNELLCAHALIRAGPDAYSVKSTKFPKIGDFDRQALTTLAIPVCSASLPIADRATRTIYRFKPEPGMCHALPHMPAIRPSADVKIGRASCRESVCQNG